MHPVGKQGKEEREESGERQSKMPDHKEGNGLMEERQEDKVGSK